MSTIKIDAAGLKVLLDHAKTTGTLEPWSDIALEYAQAAEAEIRRAHEEIEVLRLYGNKDCSAMADEELHRRRQQEN